MKKYYLPTFLIISALFIFLKIYAQNNTVTPNSTKWDYKAITIYRSSSNLTDGSWSQWFETSGDTQLSLPQPVTVTKRLRELGMQGWELVSITPISGATGGTGSNGYSDIAGFTTHVTYFLKRPL
jgi:hypothetical protein